MSDSRDTQEPSMEEILSSIRRIIADEEGDEKGPRGSAGAGQRGVRPEPSFDADDEAEEDEDVLDLTQRVEEDGEVVDLNARVAHAAEAPDREDDDREEVGEVVLEPRQSELHSEPAREADTLPPPLIARAAPRQPETRDRPQPEQKDRPTVSVNQRNRDALVDESAAGAASNAFAKFAQAVTPTPSDQRVASSDGRTVEQFAEDILRPLLKEWLDENLPAIVERVVEREVNKIARRAELL